MLTRRNLLVSGLRLSALGWATASVPLRAQTAPTSAESRAEDADQRVLVVLQLTGGNDGLNTVVPFEDDSYYRLRPSLGLARGSLHRLGDTLGLHPSLSGMAQLFGDGQLAIVQGVANPRPDRSHFRSLEVWHTADPDHPAGEVGWLGRLSDQILRRGGGSMPALSIGATNLPLSMRAEHTLAPTVRDADGFRLDPGAAELAPWEERLLRGEAAGDLGYLRQAARTTYDAVQRMEAITASGPAVNYPDTELAQQLRLVADLVAGGFGTRVFSLEFAGFDTHSRQAPVHAELLRKLSGALTAFQHDLEGRGVSERVMTFVFSEFGRRVAENGSKGTDHGCGAPVFLLGPGVRPGLHGSPPDLDRLIQGDIAGTTDFRALYTALERDWMGLTPSTRVEATPVLAPT